MEQPIYAIAMVPLALLLGLVSAPALAVEQSKDQTERKNLSRLFKDANVRYKKSLSEYMSLPPGEKEKEQQALLHSHRNQVESPSLVGAKGIFVAGSIPAAALSLLRTTKLPVQELPIFATEPEPADWIELRITGDSTLSSYSIFRSYRAEDKIAKLDRRHDHRIELSVYQKCNIPRIPDSRVRLKTYEIAVTDASIDTYDSKKIELVEAFVQDIIEVNEIQ